jgi:hypothetical protein
VAFLVTSNNVNDYDVWKPMFDSDPAGVRKAAKGHRISEWAVLGSNQ